MMVVDPERGRDSGLAGLPMYDRPELQAETDQLWSVLREAIRDAGIDAPRLLSRDTAPRLLWSAPELTLAQTCGLPYVRALRGRVGLLGAPAYAIEGVAPGEYRSAIIVPKGGPAQTLADLAGSLAAVNARDSQSGYAALMTMLAPYALRGRFLGDLLMTGSHAASISAVAEGRADVAAIDAVSWALAERHDAATRDVRVIAWSDPTPGLPFITGRESRVPTIARAVEMAIDSLGAPVREALLIEGFRRWHPQDYDVIAARLETAHRCHTVQAKIA